MIHYMANNFIAIYNIESSIHKIFKNNNSLINNIIMSHKIRNVLTTIYDTENVLWKKIK